MDDDDYNTTNDGRELKRVSRQVKELLLLIIIVIVDNEGNSVDGSGGQCVDFLLFCQNPEF